MTTKILHIINGEFYAGAERVQDLLAARLPPLGYEIGFATLKDGAFAVKRSTPSAPLIHMPMSSRFDLSIGQRLANLIKRGNYQAIHTHTPRSALAGYLAAQVTGLPVIHHVHSPAAQDTTDRIKNFINARVDHFCARRATKLIAVSSSLQQQLLKAGHNHDKIALVPNGVPVMKTASDWQKPDGIWTLGIAALFRPRKGIEILLHALADLKARGITMHLHVIGGFETNDYEQSVRTLVTRLNLDSTIQWRGFAADMNTEFAKIDMLIVPSLFGEGLPMVVIEAMAEGLPVIGTRVEGIPEVLEPIAPECLVPTGSAKALADTLYLIATNQLDVSAWAVRGHARQRGVYSDTAMAAGVAGVYRAIGL